MKYSQINVLNIQAQARLESAVAAEERAYSLDIEAERTDSELIKGQATEARKIAQIKAKQVNLKATDKRQVRQQFLERWIATLEERHLRVTTGQEDENPHTVLPDGSIVPKVQYDSFLEQIEDVIAFANGKLESLKPKKRTKAKKEKESVKK